MDVGEVSLDLYRPGDKHPRYVIYVLDQPAARENGVYAAFIVPQGRQVQNISIFTIYKQLYVKLFKICVTEKHCGFFALKRDVNSCLKRLR